MTSRIYVRGDIANPSACKVFDSDTNTELTDIIFMDITISSAVGTEATLTRRGLKGSQVVDVVPDPYPSGHSSPGDFHLKLTVERDPSMGGYTYVASINPHGEMIQERRRVLSDLDMANVYNPEALGRQVATSVLQEVVKPLIEEMVTQTKIPRVTGGRISNMAPKNAVPKRPSTSQVKKCPECNGTGEIELFNGKVPCSTCGPSDGKAMRMMIVADNQNTKDG